MHNPTGDPFPLADKDFTPSRWSTGDIPPLDIPHQTEPQRTGSTARMPGKHHRERVLERRRDIKIVVALVVVCIFTAILLSYLPPPKL
jgi:hypothetical protein